MPMLLRKRPKQFIEIVKAASDRDLSVLLIQAVKNVVEFKWRKYTRGFFLKQLIIALLFLFWFVADIINGQNIEEYEPYSPKTISFKVLSIAFLSDHILHEAKQIVSEGFIEYMIGDFWNFIDMVFVFFYISYFVSSFLYLPSDYRIVALQCIVLLVFGIKINFYLRLFEGFGFLVQMIVITFRDIGQFLLYFFILLSFMAIQISLIIEEPEGYEGISIMKWYIIALQLDISQLDTVTTHAILFWIVWFLQFIVGIIVLMNFLIAVVGNSFADCMAQREA
jgi:hypothetical protein